MIIEQASRFKKHVKKLHKNQKRELDIAIQKIIENPNIGIEKKGLLQNVRVYKFKMQKQLTLCAYILPNSQRIILLSLGGHENFYSDLENYIL